MHETGRPTPEYDPLACLLFISVLLQESMSLINSFINSCCSGSDGDVVDRGLRAAPMIPQPEDEYGGDELWKDKTSLGAPINSTEYDAKWLWDSVNSTKAWQSGKTW
ncbi:hypothetical protein V1507DRAFT_437637 [Lipomyces tetrasporus]